MAFNLNQGQFTSNRLKVIYTAAYLKGAAFAWFEPFLSDHYENVNGAKEKTKRLIDSFEEFEREMKVIFGTANEERTAAREIHQLRQTGSASAYYSTFQQVALRLDWDEDEALRDMFYQGLKMEVKAKIAVPLPTTLIEVVDEAIKVDSFAVGRCTSARP